MARHSIILLTVVLLLLSFLQVTLTAAQDRESLTHICDGYRARNQTIRIGVLNKGDTGFPTSAWSGVFETLATNFLKRFGCSTKMTLYAFAEMLTAVSKQEMDFIFCNSIQGTQFQAQYGATPMLSLTMQYESLTDRLPFPHVPASLDRYGAIMMYANGNMVKDGTANGTVPQWLQKRRALIQSYNPQTWEDLIALTSHFPSKNLTMCATSPQSLGGYSMAGYEFFKRNSVMQSLFNVNFVGADNNDCIKNLLLGNCDFATARTGTLDPWVNDTRIDPGTFTVISNNPTPYFPLFISTQLHPEWPVLYMPQVDPSLVKAFTVPLTALSIITNSPEANAVSGASFSYPFSYDQIRDMMFQLNYIGTGVCDIGQARYNYTDARITDPLIPVGCKPCLPGTYIVVENGTSTCTPCPLDTYSLTPVSTCTPCAGLSVTISTGSLSCLSPIKNVPTSTQNAMIAVCAIGIAIVFFTLFGVLWYRQHPVMKASSPLFLLLVLLGLISLCASIIPRALENKNLTSDDRLNSLSDSTCLADIYLTNIGYTLLTSALLVKTWRLHTIFSSTQLSGRSAIKDSFLFLVVCGFVLAQIVILLALTESQPMGRYVHTLDNSYDFFACSLPESSSYTLLSLYLPVQIVPRFALLIGTTIAAFLVRNLPASFNESTQLLSAMYNLVFFSILLPAIDAAVGRGTNAGVIAYSISVVLICLLTAAILFVPKFLLIIVGMEKPNGKSVDPNSKLSSSLCRDTGSGSNRTGSGQHKTGSNGSSHKTGSNGSSHKTRSGGKGSTAGYTKSTVMSTGKATPSGGSSGVTGHSVTLGPQRRGSGMGIQLASRGSPQQPASPIGGVTHPGKLMTFPTSMNASTGGIGTNNSKLPPLPKKHRHKRSSSHDINMKKLAQQPTESNPSMATAAVADQQSSTSPSPSPSPSGNEEVVSGAVQEYPIVITSADPLTILPPAESLSSSSSSSQVADQPHDAAPGLSVQYDPAATSPLASPSHGSMLSASTAPLVNRAEYSPPVSPVAL